MAWWRGAHEAEGVRLEGSVAHGRPVRPDADLQVREDSTCETPLSFRIALDVGLSYLQGQAEGVKQLVDFDAPLESAEPLERGIPCACRVRGLDQVNPNPNPRPNPDPSPDPSPSPTPGQARTRALPSRRTCAIAGGDDRYGFP